MMADFNQLGPPCEFKHPSCPRLCGFEPYYWCDGPGIESMIFYPAQRDGDAGGADGPDSPPVT